MHIRFTGRPYSRRNFIRADTPPYDDARYRALLLGFGIRIPSAHPPNRPRPHRGELPDVDFSQVVVVERPGLLARLAAWIGGRSRSRERSPLVKSDTPT
ncbi:MAG: hypothetical protein WAU86_19240 [Oricola sp.]